MFSKNSFKHITLLLILVFGFWIIFALGSTVLMANPGIVFNEIITAGDTDPITSISPSHALQGAANVMVKITLNEMTQMFFPDTNPISVKIGTLEGSNINRNGLEITAMFDIPVNEPLGMKEVSVEFSPLPIDPNAQPLILSEPGVFEILRGNISFNIGSITSDEVVTDIPTFTPGGLYDETILRTIYLDFDQNDWWQQLDRNFDAERNILADLTMDGITYPDVGVRFKGMTSFMLGMNSRKKSFNITMDETNPDQRLMGYKTLNLHNGSQDPSLIREVLYFNIFRQYAPCPQANFVKLVINGEDWGIYVNVQQNNAELVEEWFGRSDGDRWKVGTGNMGGGFFIDGNISQMPYSDWINSPMAEDLNDDGQIDEEDYDIFLDSQWNTGGTWWTSDPNMTTGGFWGGVDPVTDWLASSTAQDLNDDGEVTEEDFFIFINSPPTGGGGSDPNIPFISPDPLTSWLNSPMAEDLNDDGEVTEEDFDIFMESQNVYYGGVEMSLMEWATSGMAQDMDNDGQIDEDDYDIFLNSPMGYIPVGGFASDPNVPTGGWWGGSIFTPMPLDDWLGSPMAQDLNNDGQIDEEDYNIYAGSSSFPPGGGFIPDPNMPGNWSGPIFTPISLDSWLNSPVAQDLNDDGEINEEDYNIYLESQPTWWGGDPNMIIGGGMIMYGSGDLSWLGEDVNRYKQVYELKSANTPDPWTNLIKACDLLNNTSLEELEEVADTVLAVDRWLWFLALENIFTDEDSYLTKGWDYQLYYDPKTGQLHPLQHDGNETFGTQYADRSPFEGENDYSSYFSYPSRPMIKRLLAIPQFRERYLAHIRTILEESLNWDVLAPKIEAYRALINDKVMADTKSLYSYSLFELSFADIEDFVNQRRNYLLSNPEIAKTPSKISSVVRETTGTNDNMPISGEPVWIIASVEPGVEVREGILHYISGAGPYDQVSMFFADVPGSNYAGDILVGEIPPFPAGSIVKYYVEIKAVDTGYSNAFAPSNAEHYIYIYKVYASAADYPAVVINELMASNQTTIMDPQGEFDDWIELLNLGDVEIDLSGMYLSDKEDNPLKWQFPDGTMIAPGAYLLVWADENGGDEPGLHANFKLSSTGEAVLLTDKDERGNSLIDSVVFGKLGADISYGRSPDGTGLFQVLPEHTPDWVNPDVSDIDNDGDGYTINEGDCDDNNPNINPGASEISDMIDNDCDGLVDEGIHPSSTGGSGSPGGTGSSGSTGGSGGTATSVYNNYYSWYTVNNQSLAQNYSIIHGAYAYVPMHQNIYLQGIYDISGAGLQGLPTSQTSYNFGYRNTSGSTPGVYPQSLYSQGIYSLISQNLYEAGLQNSLFSAPGYNPVLQGLSGNIPQSGYYLIPQTLVGLGL